MGVERKQLYRFILGAFRSNEDVERFLRHQDGYGDKMANAVPNPRVDREEYAFEVADRLVRWGYTTDYLEAVIADEMLGLQARRNAAEMLGRDPWAVSTRESRSVGAPPTSETPSTNHGNTAGTTGKDPVSAPTEANSSPEPSQTTSTQSYVNVGNGSPAKPPDEGRPSTPAQPDHSIGATSTSPPIEQPPKCEVWKLVLNDYAPHPETDGPLQQELSKQLGEAVADICVDDDEPFGIAFEVSSRQANALRSRLERSPFPIGGHQVLAWYPVDAESGALNIAETSQIGRFRVGYDRGFSALYCENIEDPTKITLPGQTNPPINEETLPQALSWYFDQFHATRTSSEAHRCERTLRALTHWGKKTFQRLQNTPLGRHWFCKAKRFQIQSQSSDSEIQEWPWEALAAGRQWKFEHVKISRGLSTIPSCEELQRTEKPKLSDILKILLICPRERHSDTNDRRIDVGYREISECLVQEFHNPIEAQLHELSPATPERLAELAKAALKFDIVHFDGHGNANGELAFEDSTPGHNKLRMVPVHAITGLLQTMRARLVVLTACKSAAADGDAFSSAITIADSVGECIAMGWDLHKRGARAFTERFYAELLKTPLQSYPDSPSQDGPAITNPSPNVGDAVASGRAGMNVNSNRLRSSNFVTVYDGVVVRHFISRQAYLPSVRKPERTPPNGDSASHHSPLPSHWEPLKSTPNNNNPEGYFGFSGRDADLHFLMRWWSMPTYSGLAIWGPSGVGKTILTRWWMTRLALTDQLIGIASQEPRNPARNKGSGRVIEPGPCQSTADFFQKLAKISLPSETPASPSHDPNLEVAWETIGKKLLGRTAIIWDDFPPDLTNDNSEMKTLSMFAAWLGRRSHRLIILSEQKLRSDHITNRELRPLVEDEAVELVQNICAQGGEQCILSPEVAASQQTNSNRYLYLPSAITTKEVQHLKDWDIEELRRHAMGRESPAQSIPDDRP